MIQTFSGMENHRQVISKYEDRDVCMKEVALEKAVLAYLQHSVSIGDIKSCEALGFDIDIMKLVLEMEPIDVERVKLVNRSPIIKNITLCIESLQQLNNRARRNQKIESVIDRLLMAGATSTLINFYFPKKRQLISNRRRLLGVELPKGRPEQHTLSGKDAAVLLHLLSELRQEHSMLNVDDPITKCELMLMLVQSANCSLEEIWKVLLEAEVAGNLSW